MSSITSRLLKNKIVKESLHTQKDTQFISTGCLSINLLFSGKLYGGIPRGQVSMIAADSALGKSFVANKVIRNAQRQYDMDAALIDTEFAYSESFASTIGVNTDRMVVIQNNQLEEVQTLVVNMLEDLDRSEREKLILVIDSWGNVNTSKAVKDAKDGKDVSDMTAAKKKNSFARILTGLGCTVLIVNHVISTMDQYNPLAVGGGKGAYFACSSIVMCTSKARSKDGDEIDGAIITAKVQKGRYAVEHSKLKYMIKHDGGIHPYYGILEDALAGGFVTKPKQGWYSRPCVKDDKSWREKTIWANAEEFWKPLLEDDKFHEYFERRYSFKHNSIASTDLF